MNLTPSLPNGFNSWYETHHEIVTFITEHLSQCSKGSLIQLIQEETGTGGLYNLAFQWTNIFEEQTAGREFDGDYYDTLEAFCIERNDAERYYYHD